MAINDTLDHTHAAIKLALCKANFFPHFIDTAEFPATTPKHLIDIRVNDAPIGTRTLQIRFPNYSPDAVPMAVDRAMGTLYAANMIDFQSDHDPSNPPMGRFTISVPEANWSAFVPQFMQAMEAARSEIIHRTIAQPKTIAAADQPNPAVEGDGLSYEDTIRCAALQNQTRII